MSSNIKLFSYYPKFASTPLLRQTFEFVRNVRSGIPAMATTLARGPLSCGRAIAFSGKTVHTAL
jgi:hypothetical protein